MAKYSTEYKLKMVREYHVGQGGYRALSKRHEITESQIEHWVKAYRAFGENGLKRSRAQQTYSFEFKRSAVECYLSTEASYQDVALAHGLNNPCYEELKTRRLRSISSTTTNTAARSLLAGSVPKNTVADIAPYSKKRRTSLSYAFRSNFWGALHKYLSFSILACSHNRSSNHL